MAVTGILGKKIGMTQVFDDRGEVHPITVLKVGPCVITQLKTQAKDGYDAAQIGLVEFVKASKVNKPMTGHFGKSNVPPVKLVKEVQLESVTGGESSTTTGFSRSCLASARIRSTSAARAGSSTSASIVSSPWKASLQ